MVNIKENNVRLYQGFKNAIFSSRRHEESYKCELAAGQSKWTLYKRTDPQAHIQEIKKILKNVSHHTNAAKQPKIILLNCVKYFLSKCEWWTINNRNSFYK